VERKTEDPTGYPFVLLILCLGGLSHVPCEWDEFLIGWPVVAPPTVAAKVRIDQNMNFDHCVVEWEALENTFGRKSPLVTMEYVH
jgi:hypothetical protein